MSFSGRPKIRFNAKMNPERPALKPAAAALRKMRRFERFWDAEHPMPIRRLPSWVDAVEKGLEMAGER